MNKEEQHQQMYNTFYDPSMYTSPNVYDTVDPVWAQNVTITTTGGATETTIPIPMGVGLYEQVHSTGYVRIMPATSGSTILHGYTDIRSPEDYNPFLAKSQHEKDLAAVRKMLDEE